MSGHLWISLVDTADIIGLSMCLSVNVVLLGLIKTRGKNLGTYKYLMAFFSCFSMFYAVVEWILRPIMHIEHTTFYLISRKRFAYSTRIGKINSAFYCACFATSFVLSAVHFVYRYFATCKPDLLRLFKYPLILLWPLGCSVPVTAWASVSYCLYPDTNQTEAGVRDVLKNHYPWIAKENVSYIAYVYTKMSIVGGVMRVFQYWYDAAGDRHVYLQNLLGCFVHYFVMSMTFVVVFYCGFLTWWNINAHRGVSDRTRQLQNQLFKALVLQTLIPSVFMYMPTGVMFIAPFLDIDLNANANFIVFCSFLYPAIDPLILILIISDFRRTIMRVMRGKKVSSEATTTGAKSSQNVAAD